MCAQEAVDEGVVHLTVDVREERSDEEGQRDVSIVFLCVCVLTSERAYVS